ncbi:MAG TPA: phospholipase D-like domain-containing protein, partial [Syntrophales bacterium]|nr:phospholipase D-like domain-containing protein [Syntrophales bacterium]
LRKAGIVPVFDTTERTMHAKIAVIDRRHVFLGSHNFTQSALKYNHEVSLRVDSPALAEELLRYIRSIER